MAKVVHLRTRSTTRATGDREVEVVRISKRHIQEPPPRPRPKTQAEMGQKGHLWRTRDPVLDRICAIIDQSGMKPYAISQKIARMTGGGGSVSNVTITNWIDGKVARPSNYCVDLVAMACGWAREWRKIA